MNKINSWSYTWNLAFMKLNALCYISLLLKIATTVSTTCQLMRITLVCNLCLRRVLASVMKYKLDFSTHVNNIVNT